ncbi:MAG: membrane or secreted protein, partial [Planctomycetota bacterium]
MNPSFLAIDPLGMRTTRRRLVTAVFVFLALAICNRPASAQFTSTIDLLPESTAGVVRIPEMPTFCDAWERTQFGALLAAPEMQPFLEEQRERATSYFDTLNGKIGLKPRDVLEIASGEVVVAWLSFPDDKRRPYALCVSADIRGNVQAAEAVAKTIDTDLKNGGAQRKDLEHAGQTIRVYRTKPKPGQLKIEEIALTWNDERIIAADRTEVVKQLLDAQASGETPGAFATRESYQSVLRQSRDLIDATDVAEGIECWQWYAEPFTMGRILREVVEYDRRGSVDILALLERQGFGVIEALGGIGVVGGKKFDVLHRGVVLAPGKLTKAARMLQAINEPLAPVPSWPTADSGTFYRINWRIEQAFWAAESLVNDALGDDVFRPMLDGIRDDVEGPQIDIAKDLLPNLDDEIILVTDNTLPVSVDSDRMLVAIRIKNADVVEDLLRRAMEVDPDAMKMEFDAFDLWKVEPGQGDIGEIDDADLEALGFDSDDEEEAERLLSRWVIGVVRSPNANAPDYVMFSSHPELLMELGQRLQKGNNGDGLAALPATKAVVASLNELGADEVTLQAIFHPSLSFRARYELLRQ